MGLGYILAAPNHLGTRFSTWVAKSEASASMAAANLATAAPGKFWRSTGHNPWLTSAYGYNLLSDFFRGSNIDAFALCCHNLRPTTGRWRVRVFDGVTAGSLPVPISPSGPFGTWGNVTGDYTDVYEDPRGPLDGNFLTPTITALSMTSIGLDFPTPSNDLVAGSVANPYQAFVIDCHLINTSGPSVTLDPADPDAPYISVALYDSGVFVRLLAKKFVHDATNQTLIFPWDGTELANISGIGAGIMIDTFSGGDNRIEIDRISWWPETVDYAVAGGTEPDLLFDSGWLTAVDDPQAGTAFAAFRPTRRAIPETTLHRFADLTTTPQGIVSVQFLLMDDHAQPFPSSGFEGWIPITPDGYLQVATGFAGRAFVAEVDRELGPLVGVRDLSVKTLTDGGSGGGSQLPRLRKLYVPWEWLTSAEGAAVFDRVCLDGSILTSHVVTLLPDSAAERRMTTLYCTPDLPEVDLSAVNNNLTYNRGLSLAFLENR